jgi:hypothetical protein
MKAEVKKVKSSYFFLIDFSRELTSKERDILIGLIKVRYGLSRICTESNIYWGYAELKDNTEVFFLGDNSEEQALKKTSDVKENVEKFSKKIGSVEVLGFRFRTVVETVKEERM